MDTTRTGRLLATMGHKGGELAYIVNNKHEGHKGPDEDLRGFLDRLDTQFENMTHVYEDL